MNYEGHLHQLCAGAGRKSSSSTSKRRISVARVRKEWDKVVRYLREGGGGAVRYGALREEALDKQGPNADQTPLSIAVMRSSPSNVVEALLEIAPEAALVTDSIERLPLHWACLRPTTITAGSANASESLSSPEETIRLLVDCCPKSVVSRDKNGRTALHFLFLSHPSTRTPALLESFFLGSEREVSPDDMPPPLLPPPPPRPAVSSAKPSERTIPDTGTTTGFTVDLSEGCIPSVAPLPVLTAADFPPSPLPPIPATPPSKAPPPAVTVALPSTPLQLPLYSSHAHVHATPVRSRTFPRMPSSSRRRMQLMVAADADAAARLEPPSVPHPSNAAAVPDLNNCLPLHYAVVPVEGDDRCRELSGRTKIGVENGDSENDLANREDEGSTGLAAKKRMATPATIYHLVRRYPGSVLWRDVDGQTPLLRYLLGRESYYDSLVDGKEDEESAFNEAQGRNIDTDSKEGSGVLDEMEYNVESMGDTVVTTRVGQDVLECTLPLNEDHEEEIKDNDGCDGVSNENIDGVVISKKVGLECEDDDNSFQDKFKLPVPEKLQPIIRRYPGASSDLLPRTVLLARFGHRSSSMVSVLLAKKIRRKKVQNKGKKRWGTVVGGWWSGNGKGDGGNGGWRGGGRTASDLVCCMGDVVFGRTPLHWACHIAVSSMIQAHLRDVAAGGEEGEGEYYLDDGEDEDEDEDEDISEDKDKTEEQDVDSRDGDVNSDTERSILSPTPASVSMVGSYMEDGCGFELQDDGLSAASEEQEGAKEGEEDEEDDEVCLNPSVLRTILTANPFIVARGDALGMTPIHVLFITAYSVNRILYDTLNEEEATRPIVCSGFPHQEVDSLGSGNEQGGREGYWKTSPPLLRVPLDYVSILLSGGDSIVDDENDHEIGTDDGSVSSFFKGAINYDDDDEGDDNDDLLVVEDNGKHDQDEDEDTGNDCGDDEISHPITNVIEGECSRLKASSEALAIAMSSYDADGRLPLHYAALSAASGDVLHEVVRSNPMGLIATEDMFGRTPLHFAFSCAATAPGITASSLDALLLFGCEDKGGIDNEQAAQGDEIDSYGKIRCERKVDGMEWEGHAEGASAFGINVGVGLAALRMEDSMGNFPLHLASRNGATSCVLRRMVENHADAALRSNESGDVPLMLLSGSRCGYERMVLKDCCRDDDEVSASGNANAYLVSRTTVLEGFRDKWSCRKEKVRLLLEPFFETDEMISSCNEDVADGQIICKSSVEVVDGFNQEGNVEEKIATLEAFLSGRSSSMGESPLHIAIWHELPPSDIWRLINCCNGGREAVRMRTRDGYLPIDLHEMRRPTPDANGDHDGEGRESCESLTTAEWEEIQEMLFVHHPKVRKYRKDEDGLLRRLSSRIRSEVLRTTPTNPHERKEEQQKQVVAKTNKEKDEKVDVSLKQVESTDTFDAMLDVLDCISMEVSFDNESSSSQKTSCSAADCGVDRVVTAKRNETYGRGGIPRRISSDVQEKQHEMGCQKSLDSNEGLTAVSSMAWQFFITYSNPTDPDDHYAHIVERVVDGLSHGDVKKLCDFLKSDFSLENAEPNPLCVRVLDSRFYLFGSFNFFVDGETTLPTGSSIGNGRKGDTSMRTIPHSLPHILHKSSDDESILLRVEFCGAKLQPSMSGGNAKNLTTGKSEYMCLKLMKSMTRFNREIKFRGELVPKGRDGGEGIGDDFDVYSPHSIVPVNFHYSSSGNRDLDRRFRSDLNQETFQKAFLHILESSGYPTCQLLNSDSENTTPSLSDYCCAIAMPIAEFDLMQACLCGARVSTATERKACVMEVGNAIDALHKRNIIHGDIHMRNVLFMAQGGWKLSGLGVSCKGAVTSGTEDNTISCGDFMGEIGTYRTSVLPPEMFFRLQSYEQKKMYNEYCRSVVKSDSFIPLSPNYHWDPVIGPDGDSYVVKSFNPRNKEACVGSSLCLPYELVPASPSFDIWAFGCLLYSIYSGRPIFPTDMVHGNLTDSSSFRILAQWDNEKAEMLIYEHIEDPLLQDLLLHVLSPTEERCELSMEDVLRHPFFSGSHQHQENGVEPVSPFTTLSKTAQKIFVFRKAEAGRLKASSRNREKLRILDKQIQERTVIVRRLPMELQMKLDFASSAIALAASLIAKKEASMDASPICSETGAWFPLCFVILPYKLVPNKSGRLTPSNKKGVELAEKVGKQLLSISKAIDTFLLDPLQSAKDKIEESIINLLQHYDDAPKSYIYLVDQYNGIPITREENNKNEVYPWVIPNHHARHAVLKYLPFIHIAILHARASFKSISGLVKLIFDGAYPHIPVSWDEEAKGLLHRFDEPAMVSEIKALMESVLGLERKLDHPEAGIDMLQSLQRFFEHFDPAMTFAGLWRVTDGGFVDLWTTELGIMEIKKKTEANKLMTSYQEYIHKDRLIEEKNSRIEELEKALHEEGKENIPQPKKKTV